MNINYWLIEYNHFEQQEVKAGYAGALKHGPTDRFGRPRRRSELISD